MSELFPINGRQKRKVPEVQQFRYKQITPAITRTLTSKNLKSQSSGEIWWAVAIFEQILFSRQLKNRYGTNDRTVAFPSSVTVCIFGMFLFGFCLFVCLLWTHSAGLLYMGGILSIVENCCSWVNIWPLLQCQLFNVVGVVWIIVRCGCYSVNYTTLTIQWKVMKVGCDGVSCWMLLLQCQFVRVCFKMSVVECCGTVSVCTSVFHNVSCWMLLLQCQFVRVCFTMSVAARICYIIKYCTPLLQCRFLNIAETAWILNIAILQCRILNIAETAWILNVAILQCRVLFFQCNRYVML